MLRRVLLVWVLLLGFGLGGAASADPVLDWNDLALAAVAVDHSGPSEQAGPARTGRALAMVHAAIYDAVREAQRRPAEPVSLDIAVGFAARDVLLALYPSQQEAFDAALLAVLTLEPSEAVRRQSIELGVRAARRVLRERRNDGSDAPMPWTPSPEPGHHGEDPLHPGQGFLGAGWGDVEPFVLRRGSQFRPPPPPSLDSAEYSAAFDEVKRLGGDGVVTPTERSAEQTEIGIYWGYDGTKGLGPPPRLYNQIARVIAEQEGNDVAENARLFLLVNLALADAGIACWEAKYHYDFWRPVLGIRYGSVIDSTWTPLGAPASNQSGTDFTPPFPAYPSGHATFGAALFRILERFYGTDAIAFTFVSDELNGITTDWAGNVRPPAARSFTSLDQATQENADSRIYLGIHWSFDASEGITLGEHVADWVFDQALTPKGRRR